MAARRDRWIPLGVMLAVVATTYACQEQEPMMEVQETLFEKYMDPPPLRSFPASEATINGWIAAEDTASIRQHGWDIWESITSNVIGGTMEPIWETWYSGHEIFETDTLSAAAVVAAAQGDPSKIEIPRSKVRVRFELPLQFAHTGRRFSEEDRVGSVFSFNRFTRSTAQQIRFRGLWNWNVLKAINDSFNTNSTPVANRQVLVSRDSTDSMSFVLKPVFQFIDGTSPSCIPYWAGDDSTVTDSAGMNPIAREWKQFVIVDPGNKLTAASSVADRAWPGCPTSQVAYPIVKLNRFYWRRLTQAMVDSFPPFAAGGGDDLGLRDSATQSAILSMVKPGNIGLLVAMHVTGKEIPNWTWQSFWWSPTPDDSLGFDRPATIGAPWNNYQMTTAYYMTSPASAGPAGTPRIAYNPYLETSLTGTVDTAGGSSKPWYGPQTNCMSCHRMASWRNTVDTVSADSMVYSFTGPVFPYVPASYVDPGNTTLLSGLTKTDFLWSVAIRTHGVPPYVRAAKARP